ncbi:MAG: class I SAM-dependent methyltransferase, partial [Sphingobacteriales bacterium]
MAANYNNSAWFYDSLATLVYGKALVNAQVYLLKHIPSNSKVLIVGGGTGWILEELARVYSSGLQITYVEIAPNMMAQSKKRNVGNNQVTFINDAIENVNLSADYNIALTPFLLDNFTEEGLNKIFSSIAVLLKPNALWLNTSFQLTGKWWQQIMLQSMFILFKVICNIEASK